MLKLFAVLSMLYPGLACAADGVALTGSIYAILALVIFVIAYVLVVSEEFLHLRKSKPVIIAAGAIWLLVALAYSTIGDNGGAERALRANLLEFAELMLFLLSAMTFINTLAERNVFDVLRAWMVSRGFSLRTIYWLSGLLAFFISPLADNLTTSLLMGAVVLAVARDNKRFVVVSCVNVVVAANAGGAFSPFGDITTLMVWQKGMVRFEDFFLLFVPALVNWLVPALCMSFVVERGRPAPLAAPISIKPGGVTVLMLFLATIVLTVSLHQFLHLPPFLGMMTGLGVLMVHGYWLRRSELREPPTLWPNAVPEARYKPAVKPFDIFISLKRVEWDTLMFFYGVVLCVGGLGALGYLAELSQLLYAYGPTVANVYVGIASAIVDNIPVMYAVLSMQPDMSLGQWLLVTLTAGVGGSLLSIGSAAGVGLMGQARGIYTFFAHLKWAWAIALGYAASIATHLWLNAAYL